MKIVLVTNYAPPNQGGVEVVVDQLARGYQAAGHTPVVSALDLTRERGRGLPYRIDAMPGANPLERWSIPVPVFEPVTLWRRTARLLADADAVHAHGLLYPNVVAALELARRRDIPAVVTEHVGLVSSGHGTLDRVQAIAFRTMVRRVAGRSARAVVVLNERVHDEVAASLPAGVALVRIDNGVDTEAFRPADPATDERNRLRRTWSLDRPTVLFAGRLARKKGLDLVLGAAAADPSFDVVVCGRDTERLLDRPDRPATVRILGRVEPTELAELYRAADALVLPSEGEGFPLVVQEAMASGLPVVVTRDAVPARGPHVGVVRVAERDPASLARAIRTVLDDPGDASRRGREVALAHFDWATTVHRYLELLEETT